MPYGTMKARTGDPYNWISDRLADELGVNEGLLGTLGGAAAGSLLTLGSPIGAALGAGAGQELTRGGSRLIESECNHTEEGEYCPEHGLAECGTYEDAEDNEIVRNAKKLTDGWKGTLAGSAAGGIAGDMAGQAVGPAAGAALGGAVGGVPGAIAGGAMGALAGGPVGGAIGGLAGGKIGDKLGGPEETDEGIGPIAGGLAGLGIGAKVAGLGIPGAVIGATLGALSDPAHKDEKQETDEESQTAHVVKGAMKAATQGLGDVSGSGKEIAKNLLAMESNSDSALLARIKSLALIK
jgi:hypothetical protein